MEDAPTAERLIFTPVRRLAELVRTRQVSPVELAETFLERLEKDGPRLNAVVTLTRDRALDAARRAEREIATGRWRGPLHGIPYGAKDLIATAGTPTTWGAAPLRGQAFEADATVVRKLDEAGAVLVAKLAMVEFAGGMGYRQPNASLTGPGVNPWDVSRWSGGSSSGSGSAVAAGLVPFAIGSETWGSILGPAGYCGIAGLRPSYGRVSRHGAMVLSWTLDKLGPLTLTADDSGLVLEAIAGEDPADPSTAPEAFVYDDADLTGRAFRFAVLPDLAASCDDDVRASFERSLDVLASLGTVEELRFPDLPYEAAARVVLNAEAASAFEDLVESGTIAGLTAPEDRYTAYARDAILAKDYLRALRIGGVIAREIDRAMSGFDALVGPGRPNLAPPLDQEFRSAMRGSVPDPLGAIGNIAGLPAIAIPNGFGDGDLPASLQLVGRPWGENTILAAARAYQSRTDWHMRHPDVQG